jgi:hypothetical protein
MDGVTAFSSDLSRTSRDRVIRFIDMEEKIKACGNNEGDRGTLK